MGVDAPPRKGVESAGQSPALRARCTNTIAMPLQQSSRPATAYLPQQQPSEQPLLRGRLSLADDDGAPGCSSRAYTAPCRPCAHRSGTLEYQLRLPVLSLEHARCRGPVDVVIGMPPFGDGSMHVGREKRTWQSTRRTLAGIKLNDPHTGQLRRVFYLDAMLQKATSSRCSCAHRVLRRFGR